MKRCVPYLISIFLVASSFSLFGASKTYYVPVEMQAGLTVSTGGISVTTGTIDGTHTGDGSGLTGVIAAATSGVTHIEFDGTNYFGELVFVGSGIRPTGSVFTFSYALQSDYETSSNLLDSTIASLNGYVQKTNSDHLAIIDGTGSTKTLFLGTSPNWKWENFELNVRDSLDILSEVHIDIRSDANLDVHAGNGLYLGATSDVFLNAPDIWLGTAVNIADSVNVHADSLMWTGMATSVSELVNLGALGTIPWRLTEVSADPSDPAEGKSVFWQSDGTGFGEDGDICMKVQAGGVIKTNVYIAFAGEVQLADGLGSTNIASISFEGTNVVYRRTGSTNEVWRPIP